MTEFASASQGFSLISNRKLLALYSAMLACRAIAEKARAQAKENRAWGSVESVLGREAAAVGAAIDLTAGDIVAPALWPDAALKAISPNATVAASFPLATRHALATKDSPRITLLISSGKRASRPAWLKALTLAAEHNLPIIFVSLVPAENSENSIDVESFRLDRRKYALPHIVVDGSDVVAVYRVASEAICHARNSHGPTLIDCLLSANVDPIRNMQTYLIGKGLDPAEFAA
jgi:TPP-dependent pyruvate/acetoin dehydrogenase alpha subunit